MSVSYPTRMPEFARHFLLATLEFDCKDIKFLELAPMTHG